MNTLFKIQPIDESHRFLTNNFKPGDSLSFVYIITLGSRDFSSAVSGFCQVFIVTRAFFSRLIAARGFGLRPTENSRRTREKPLVPRVVYYQYVIYFIISYPRLCARAYHACRLLRPCYFQNRVII